MSFGGGVSQLIGRTVRAVVLSERKEPSTNHHKIFLLLDDGSHYEIYGPSLNTPARTYPRGLARTVEHCLAENEKVQVFLWEGDSTPATPDEIHAAIAWEKRRLQADPGCAVP